MLSYQPDQTAYLLNKLVEGHGGGGGGGKLYNETGQHTDGAMTQKATTDALGTKANTVDVGNALAGKVDKEAGKGIIPLNDYLTITTDQTATGQKTFANVTKIQSGQGTGSMWIGGNVNSNNLSNNQRHLARISVPSYSDITLGHTMLGFDSSGDSDMHVANKTYDALSFGGMKKITNASSPMAIGFCVTDTRYATAANKKIYPLELDANEARFNVKPNYNGTNLALITDIPGQYILPPATSSTLGGIKVGNNLSITSDGTLSASGGTLPSNLVYHDDPGSVTPVTPYVSFADLIWAGIFDKIYPVGSIFMSATLSTPADVATALGGGTWVAWGSGRVPVGVDPNDTSFDTVEETGGEKTHTLTVAEMPSHRHYTSNYSGGGNTQGMATTNAQVHGDTSYWNFNNPGNSSATGGDGAHNNLQPYITCYMYKRTA